MNTNVSDSNAPLQVLLFFFFFCQIYPEVEPGRFEALRLDCGDTKRIANNDLKTCGKNCYCFKFIPRQF